MVLKFIKSIGIKLIYILFFAGMLIFIILFFLNIFNKYFNTFNLSEEVNTYLESVSLKQINIEQADKIIENFNTASTSPLIFEQAINDPFASFAVEASEEN